MYVELFIVSLYFLLRACSVYSAIRVSFLILLIYVFFSLSVLLGVYQFYWFFQEQVFWFIYFLYFFLFKISLIYALYYSFPQFDLVLLCSSSSRLLRREVVNWRFSLFYNVCIVIHFLLSNVLAVSYKFWYAQF